MVARIGVFRAERKYGFRHVPSYRSYSAKSYVRRSPDVERTNDTNSVTPQLMKEAPQKNGAFWWLPDLDLNQD
jgi:hypothetical protein